MNFITDTSLPAIGSTSHYGHRWDTHSAIVDALFPKPCFTHAHRLPDQIIISSRYLKECRTLHAAYLEIV